MQERFERLGLHEIWGSYDEFATATQWHQFAALKFEIEALRRQPRLAGYVITELSDIYWESNGLLDFYRNPKVYHERFAEINGEDMVTGRPGSYAYWQDEKVNADLYASHYSRKSWTGASLRWSILDTHGELKISDLKIGEALSIGMQAWSLPVVDKARTVPVKLEVLSESGEELARNVIDLLVLPTSVRQASYRLPVAVMMRQGQSRTPVANRNYSTDKVPHSAFGSALDKLGYEIEGKLTADTGIAITDYPSESMLRWVREGGKLLFLSGAASPFFWAQGRGGTYGGSWLTSFSWLKPEVHPRLQVDNPLGLPYMRVMPERTILGLPVEDRAVQGDFLAGQVSGWVGHPAVHTVRFRYGKGKVIMTTFNIAAAAGEDPVATAMLHDLVDHLASEACEPLLRANY